MVLKLSLTADQREFVRIPFRFKATFNVVGQANKTLDMYTRDVSAGGLGLELATDQAPFWRKLRQDETNLRLQFKLPGSKNPNICQAKVMWKGKITAGKDKKYFLGLSFTDLDKPTRLRISEAIRKAFLKRLNRERKKIGKRKK